MNYESMTTSELKKLVIQKMSERESIHYVFGWLKQSYILAMDEDIERAVAIKQLKEYEVA